MKEKAAVILLPLLNLGILGLGVYQLFIQQTPVIALVTFAGFALIWPLTILLTGLIIINEQKKAMLGGGNSVNVDQVMEDMIGDLGQNSLQDDEEEVK